MAATSIYSVVLKDIRKSFGAADVIRGVNLTVAPGEFCVFVGPSGCGKSTLLRIIAGLEDATFGQINIGGKDVTHAEPSTRGIAMVFQSYALYSHLTVGENTGFGLLLAKLPKALMADKIVVLNGGRIEQVGTPMELYNAPVSPFVAGFIGSPKMNLYDGTLADEPCATYGIPPEHLQLTEHAPRWAGTVRHLERLGADTVVYLTVPALGEMVVRADGDTYPAIGSTCGVSPMPEREFRFG